MCQLSLPNSRIHSLHVTRPLHHAVSIVTTLHANRIKGELKCLRSHYRGIGKLASVLVPLGIDQHAYHGDTTSMNIASP
jgi:hypothetical protein